MPSPWNTASPVGLYQTVFWCFTSFHMHVGNLTIFFGEMSVQDLCPTFNYIIFSYWIVGDLFYVFWVLPLIGRDFYFLHWLFLLLRESSLVWDWGASWAWQPGFRCNQLCPWGFSGRWGVKPREALEVFRLVNRIRYMYSGEQEVKPWIKQSGRWAPDTWGQHPSL